MAETTRSIGRIALASRDEPLTRLHWVAIGLALTTGVVHLYLYVAQGFLPFLLAGLGFLGAVVLLVAGVNRRVLYVVGVPFTAVQIVAWVALGMPDFALGVFDKTVEVALVVALAYLFVIERRAKRAVERPTDTSSVAAVATGR
ncbi:DUF7475 family protein [Halorarius litoreus]|uniref:DUF7475 family protein n=1 Tax=Halorarius litoreus TaxID=2962676 RepID=UPI0020CED33B|nr:hypothetical protein [Halorarius litoreus]